MGSKGDTARRGPTRLARAALVGVGALLALGAAELAYRGLRADELSPTTNPSLTARDPDLGWRLRPGAVARHRTDEFDVEVRIGPHGFRGEPAPPRADALRVLVLGDSLAFGWGVAEDETLTAAWERLDPKVQVLNAAVSGYGTDQQLLLLRQLRRDPAFAAALDAVVVVFCANDLMESNARRCYGRPKPWFEWSGVVEASPLELRGVPVPGGLFDGSQLARAVVKHWEPTVHAGGRTTNEARWPLVAELFRMMAAELGGTPLLLVSEAPELAALAEETPGLHHLDLRPHLEPPADGEPLVFPRDGHWTPRGHRRVAEALRAWFADFGG